MTFNRMAGFREGWVAAMARLSVFLLLTGLVAGLARAGSPDPRDLEIPSGERLRARGLIPQLGSNLFHEREKAEQELAKMGRSAGPALRAALAENVDPEIRQRAGRLLPKAQAAELQARTEAFLADAEGQYDHAMPGWQRFKQLTHVEHELLGLPLGTDRAASRSARELFVEMLRSKPTVDLLAAVEKGGDELPQAIADRRMQMWLDMNPGVFVGGVRGNGGVSKPPSLAEFAALLFAESQLEGKTVPRVGPFFIATSQFFHAPAIRPAFQSNAAHANSFRKVTAGWFRNLTDTNELQQVAFQVTQLNIKEALPAMRRAVTTAGTPVYLRAQALGAVAKLGGQNELPLMRRLLRDETTVQANRFPNKMDLQLRDVALAMCLVVTGQDAKAFGFELQQPLNEQIKYQYWTYAFRTPEKRTEAIKKWNGWDEQNRGKD